MTKLNIGDEVEVSFKGMISYMNGDERDEDVTYDIDLEDGSNIQYVPSDYIVVTKRKLSVKVGDVVLTDRGQVFILNERSGVKYYSRTVHAGPHDIDSFEFDAVKPVKIIGNVTG